MRLRKKEKERIWLYTVEDKEGNELEIYKEGEDKILIYNIREEHWYELFLDDLDELIDGWGVENLVRILCPSISDETLKDTVEELEEWKPSSHNKYSEYWGHIRGYLVATQDIDEEVLEILKQYKEV